MKYSLFSSIFIVSLALGGCAEHQSIVEPNAISLKKAMVDTVDALAATHAESVAQRTHFGFYGCTVTAVFNISATGTVDNKIALSATGGPPAAIAPVSVNLSGSHEATETGTRGNTVTVVLATPECQPSNKAEGAKTPTSSKPNAPSKPTPPIKGAAGQKKKDGVSGPVINQRPVVEY